MLGLERAYYEVDSARVRVIKLVAMERLSQEQGIPIIVKLMEVGSLIDEVQEQEDKLVEPVVEVKS